MLKKAVQLHSWRVAVRGGLRSYTANLSITVCLVIINFTCDKDNNYFTNKQHKQQKVMAQFDKLKPHLLKWEGGFANDPYDTGGATYKGVTINTYTAFCKKRGYPRPTVHRLKNMPQEHWDEIAKIFYWDRWQADKIKDQRIANLLVDWLWHSGVYGIKIPQRILNLTPDGIVGDKTLDAINSQDPQKLFNTLKQERLKYLQRITTTRPSQIRFLKGWENRVNDL